MVDFLQGLDKFWIQEELHHPTLLSFLVLPLFNGTRSSPYWEALAWMMMASLAVHWYRGEYNPIRETKESIWTAIEFENA